MYKQNPLLRIAETSGTARLLNSKPVNKLIHDVLSRDTSPSTHKCIPEASMHTHGGLRSAEASDAAWEGGRGAVYGSVKVSHHFLERGRESQLICIDDTLVGSFFCFVRRGWICDFADL